MDFIATLKKQMNITHSGGWVIDDRQWVQLCDAYASRIPFTVMPDYTPRPTILFGVPVLCFGHTDNVT